MEPSRRKKRRSLLPPGKPVGRRRAPAAVTADGGAFWGRSKIRAAAEAILEEKGTRGVCLGLRRRGGQWREEVCITVFVETKWPADRLHPGEAFGARFPGLPIDVIEVGATRTTTVTAADLVYHESLDDRSAITAVLNYTSGVWLLTSGHGVVPQGKPGATVSKPGALQVFVSDDNVSRYTSTVHFAEFNGSADSALLRLDDGPDALVEHPATASCPPFTLRTEPIVHNTLVRHYSPNRRRMVEGVVTAFADYDTPTGVYITAPSGDVVFYPEIYCVTPTEGTFSEPGDSGSLVVDADRMVVGTVVGGSKSSALSFVLPLTPDNLSRRSTGIDLGKFFR